MRDLISNSEAVAFVESIARGLNLNAGALLETDVTNDRRKRSLNDLMDQLLPNLLTPINIAVQSIVNTILIQLNSATDGMFTDALVNIGAFLCGLINNLIPVPNPSC